MSLFLLFRVSWQPCDCRYRSISLPGDNYYIHTNSNFLIINASPVRMRSIAWGFLHTYNRGCQLFSFSLRAWLCSSTLSHLPKGQLWVAGLTNHNGHCTTAENQ